MEQKRNYQKEMEKVLEAAQKEGTVPTLFLHSCCAPCSSYVLEYLSQYFRITFADLSVETIALVYTSFPTPKKNPPRSAANS